MNRRHRLHDRRCKDSAHPVNRIVVDIAGAHGQVHDFAGTHENALQSGLMPCSFDVFDGLDDKRRRDFVNLAPSERLDDVPLHSAFFVLIADDAAAFQVFPECPCIP